jgi:hypothetical protein
MTRANFAEQLSGLVLRDSTGRSPALQAAIEDIQPVVTRLGRGAEQLVIPVVSGTAGVAPRGRRTRRNRGLTVASAASRSSLMAFTVPGSLLRFPQRTLLLGWRCVHLGI